MNIILMNYEREKRQNNFWNYLFTSFYKPDY